MLDSRNEVINIEVLLHVFYHRIILLINVFVESRIQCEWGAWCTKQNDFEAINVKGTCGIFWVTQPEEACGISVSFIKTEM